MHHRDDIMTPTQEMHQGIFERSKSWFNKQSSETQLVVLSSLLGSVLSLAGVTVDQATQADAAPLLTSIGAGGALAVVGAVCMIEGTEKLSSAIDRALQEKRQNQQN